VDDQSSTVQNSIIFATVILKSSKSIFKGLFGCKEVGGSKEIGKYNCSLPYLSKHQKRKIRKPLFLFSFLFYTIIFSLLECYS